MDGGVGFGALAGQGGELVHREIRGGARLLAGDARLRQLALGFANLELRIEARADAAAGDVDDVLALRLGALRDVRERVLAIELDIGLGDGAREHQPRVVLVQTCRHGEIPRAMHGVGLLAPRSRDPSPGSHPPGSSRRCVRQAAAE